MVGHANKIHIVVSRVTVEPVLLTNSELGGILDLKLEPNRSTVLNKLLPHSSVADFCWVFYALCCLAETLDDKFPIDHLARKRVLKLEWSGSFRTELASRLLSTSTLRGFSDTE
jgi:hypothetical protein